MDTPPVDQELLEATRDITVEAAAFVRDGFAAGVDVELKGDGSEVTEIDLFGALSACPGGDCSAEHSSDVAACHPLLIEVFAPDEGALEGWAPPAVNGYDRGHGR